MNSLLATQGAFAGLCLLVGAFLVINLMSHQMAGQAREIAVMKTLGAQPSELARLYLVMAGGSGLLAGLMAVPLAAVIGQRWQPGRA